MLDLQTPSTAPVTGGGFDLMGPSNQFGTAAPAVGGGFDLLGGAPAPAPSLMGGMDLLGGTVAAPPVALDPFAAVMSSPQTPAVAAPDPFGLVAAPAGTIQSVSAAAPADPFGLGVALPAAAPAAAPAGGVDFLGGLAGGPPAAAVEELPEGWVKKESKQYAGRFFYFHAETNTTTWDKPTAAAAAAAAPAAAPAGSPKSAKKAKTPRGMMGKAKAAKAAMEQAAAAAASVGVKESPKAAETALPPGWEKKESSQYPGKFFYYNQTTKETTWERPAAAAAAAGVATSAAAPEPAGMDLLGMFAAPPAPAPAPPVVNALGLPPSAAAPQLAGASKGSAPPAAGASADGVALPSRTGPVKKETGVRHIWQPRYLKLAGGVLSWSKYETDSADRGSVALDSTWHVGVDELRSGCSPADVDGRGSFVRVGSSAKGGGFVFRVHKKSDHQNRMFFEAETAELRDQWVADIQASIDGTAKSPVAKAASPEPGSPVVSAKKAGKFMKGMRKQMQAAAMGGIGGDPADFEDDEEPLFAIACPSRSGMLQKESTGLRHQVCV